MTKIFKVAKVSDLKDGQMKEVEIPGTEGKVLLSRVKGSFYATGSKCTRMWPKLCWALMDRLWRSFEEWRFDRQWTTCLSLAWYIDLVDELMIGACFKIQTGDIEEAPAQDALPCFKTTIDGNDVSIEINNLGTEILVHL
jgi:apoptosis-inducing factor 3